MLRQMQMATSWRHQKYSFPVLVVLLIFGIAIVVFKLSELLINNRTFRQRSFLKTLNELAEQIPFESIHNDNEFLKFSYVLKEMDKPPYLIFYDSSNVDTVLNHVCNLKFIPNALPRLVAISFDKHAHNVLKAAHPSVPSVVIDHERLIKTLEPDVQNRRYLIYTLALLTHAKVCASLASRGIDFWSMHQDTIWIENFDSMNIEDRYSGASLLFDTIGNDMPKYKRMQNWICGATFFARASPVTYQFFRQVESFMLSYQSPDSSIMSYLCGHHKYKCEFLPHDVVSSFDYFEGSRRYTPILLQMDSDKTVGKTKMDVLRRGGMVFRREDGSCDDAAFLNLRRSVQNAFPERQKPGELKENNYQKLVFAVKNISNIDPYNRKWFLKIHESLI